MIRHRRFWRHLCRLIASGRLCRDTCGQSVVEFALVAPIFFFLVFGFIQVGLWTFGIALTQIAVREGCRTGVTWYQPRPAWWDRQDSNDDTSCGFNPTTRCDPAQTSSSWKLAAEFEAKKRARELIELVQVATIRDLDAEIREEVNRSERGREGTREIVVTAEVDLLMLVTYFGNSFRHTSQCRMRLERFYSY
ncbi:MAG: pilus assembly protein [Chloroflexi bacterium]|nr:pilus assembly protein [Chloroflexota bacterium]